MWLAIMFFTLMLFPSALVFVQLKKSQEHQL